MTETAASSSKGRPAKKAPKAGFFARIALFVRQVIGELKKVVAPTRKELINYTLVVLVFVVIMMLIVTLLDSGLRDRSGLGLRRHGPHGQLRRPVRRLRGSTGNPEGTARCAELSQLIGMLGNEEAGDQVSEQELEVT